MTKSSIIIKVDKALNTISRMLRSALGSLAADSRHGSLRIVRSEIMKKTAFLFVLLSLVFTLSARADINDDLLKAAGGGHTATVKALLAKGADINTKDQKGTTALMWAARKKETETVNALVDLGADVNVKSKYGMTVLLFAVVKEETEIVKILLEKGADVNINNEDGETALMLAAENGDTVTMKVLLEKGADVNIKKEDGETALMLAEKEGYTKIIELLKQAGAEEQEHDVNIKTEHGVANGGSVTASLCENTLEIGEILEIKKTVIIPKQKKLTTANIQLGAGTFSGNIIELFKTAQEIGVKYNEVKLDIIVNVAGVGVNIIPISY